MSPLTFLPLSPRTLDVPVDGTGACEDPASASRISVLARDRPISYPLREVHTLDAHELNRLFALGGHGDRLLLRKPLELDKQRCACGATMRVIAIILDPEVIRGILHHRSRPGLRRPTPPGPVRTSPAASGVMEFPILRGRHWHRR